MTTKPKLPQIENMTQNIEDALTGASSPSSSNVFATMSDVGGGSLLASYAWATYNHGAGAHTVFGGAVSVPSNAVYGILQGSVRGPAVTGMDLGDFNISIDVSGSTMIGYALYNDGTASGMGGIDYDPAVSIASPPVTVVPPYGEDSPAIVLHITQWSGAGGTITLVHNKGAGGASSIAVSLRFFG